MILLRSTTSHYRLFFFNDTATTEIYTLSLHDALPISLASSSRRTSLLAHLLAAGALVAYVLASWPGHWDGPADRKSTRLNSSHQIISYAVFCLKKKKTNTWSPMSIVSSMNLEGISKTC